VLGDVGRGRSAHRPAELRGRVTEFDRTGFPVFHSRTGRRRTDRTRMTLVAVAVATIATVPVMVLWQAAHGGDRHTARGTTISAARVTSLAPEPGHAGESAGHTAPMATTSSAANSTHHPDPPAPPSSGPPGEDAEPLPSASGTSGPAVVEAAPGPSALPGATVVGTVGQGPVAPTASAAAEDKPLRPQSASGSAADRRASPLVVEAAHNGERTVVTLRNTGATPVDWTAEPSADWLRLSRTTGTLAPGAAETITVTVDSATAPSGSWSANVLIEPGGSRVWIEGSTGGGSPTSTAEPTATGRPPVTSAPPSEPAGGR
ncbi:MAG TPA: hypothetical protein VLH10_15685, partial [Yinghuangia sp.]|nr:hypothetical protein [Yinghuangia sp.]